MSLSPKRCQLRRVDIEDNAMASEFDELQELVLEDARKVYSETTIDFMNPRNLGDMDGADGFAKATVPAATLWRYGLR